MKAVCDKIRAAYGSWKPGELARLCSLALGTRAITGAGVQSRL